MEMLPQVGQPIRVIGRYALYGKLAAGGMATVHFGRLLGPAGFSRTVAIKRLHPQFAKDPEFVAMFLDEARVAARIQHPNVVATVDVVAMAEELFLVMDYVRGESFSRLLRASRKKGIEVSLAVVASVISGTLHGLHAAHEAKDEQGRPLSVVHRDVSPQNVLVGVDGVPRVLDFGVAKAAARIQVTRDGQMKGKLSYMAPEQLQGRGVDRRTDNFAAAIVAWEALTGRRLFDAEEPQEVLRMIVSEEIPPPSAVVPSIPRAIDAIVMKGLARDVSLRYQTAREFAIALEEATHLASPREVGEWVEKVAGDTLLQREQAVAEIEAISAVSEVSGALPGRTRTIVGLAPPPPAAPASDWDEGPTRIYDSATSVSLGDDQATRAHKPRPTRPPLPPREAKLPPIPSLIPPAVRAPQRPGPKSGRPPPASVRPTAKSTRPPAKSSRPPPRSSLPPAKSSRPPPKSSLPPPRASLPPPRASLPPNKSTRPPTIAGTFDDTDKTEVKNPPQWSDDGEKTQVLEKSQPGWDDEGETTTVLDKSGADELLDAALRVTGPPNARRLGPPPPRPAAGSPPAAVTVIVQDNTSPALRVKRPAPWVLGVAWLWGSPSARARRVGLVAGIAGLFIGVALYAAHGKRQHAPRNPAPVMEEASPERLPVVATTVAEPEPHGIDPSMLPREPARPARNGRERARTAGTSLGATETPPAEETPAPTAPGPPAPAAESDDLESPYAHTLPKAPPKASSTPTSKSRHSVHPVTPGAPAVPASKTPAGCAQPFTVDEHGIRRIKPECL